MCRQMTTVGRLMPFLLFRGFFTLSEAVDFITEDESQESYDVVAIPPVDGEESDKESGDENEHNIDNLGVRMLQTEVELLNFADDEDTNADRETKERKNINWSKTVVNDSPQGFQPSQVTRELKELECASDYQFFELFFDENVREYIRNETERYARQKGKLDFKLNDLEVKIVIGVLLYSGYMQVPYRRMYWETSKDAHNSFVSNCIPRNRFEEILSVLHLANNDLYTPGVSRRDFKVVTLIDMLNERFKLFPMSQNLSIDESMCKYYGKHSAKQFMRQKPIRFGFKLWVLASSSGYCYHLNMYTGKTDNSNSGPLGSSVVNALLKSVPPSRGHHVYFDNFFTSVFLLTSLKSKGYEATGTIRDNRTLKAPLASKKEMAKEERGSYDHIISDDIMMVRWKDNAVVTLCTNVRHDPKDGQYSVKRWSRKDRKMVTVPQPKVVAMYNCHMGGVDLHDQFISNYRVNIRGKKWWWTIFTYLIDACLKNAWLIRREYGTKPSLLEFRRNVVIHYLTASLRKRSAPLTATLSVRKSGGDTHYPLSLEKQRRCRVCHKSCRLFCQICSVPLHMHCFESFHSK